MTTGQPLPASPHIGEEQRFLGAPGAATRLAPSRLGAARSLFDRGTHPGGEGLGPPYVKGTHWRCLLSQFLKSFQFRRAKHLDVFEFSPSEDEMGRPWTMESKGN